MNKDYGYSVISAEETALLHQIDNKFSNMISSYKVNEWYIPALIDGKVLERCGYFSTLTNHLTKVGIIKRDCLDSVSKNNNLGYNDFDNTPNLYLTPAACLHFYPVLEEHPITNEIITTRARVFRYENSNFTSLERQWDFTVREFVAVGNTEFVNSFLEDMERKLFDYASDLFENISLESANDLFYPTKENKRKERFQLKNNLKKELIAKLKDSNLAISSFNFHGEHFSKEFNFDLSGTIVSGCVGCGLERWLRILKD